MEVHDGANASRPGCGHEPIDPGEKRLVQRAPPEGLDGRPREVHEERGCPGIIQFVELALPQLRGLPGPPWVDLSSTELDCRPKPPFATYPQSPLVNIS